MAVKKRRSFIMINREYSIRLIDKLIELTSERKIVWVSLPHYFEVHDNEPLRKAVIANNFHIETTDGFLVNEYRSYCTSINGGIITLFTKSCGKDIKRNISIQVTPTHYLQDLYCDNEIQEKLSKLLLKISMGSDGGLKFINEILNL